MVSSTILTARSRSSGGCRCPDPCFVVSCFDAAMGYILPKNAASIEPRAVHSGNTRGSPVGDRSAESLDSYSKTLEATPRIELGMEVLQTSALPLGYVAAPFRSDSTVGVLAARLCPARVQSAIPRCHGAASRRSRGHHCARRR